MLDLEVPGENSSQPYIAGYMTTDWIWRNPGKGSASAVRVTVSFAGTDKSIIQSDNWLMAGIAAQGPDTVYGGCAAIDWGYTFTLVVAPGIYSNPFVHAEVWECHEWGDDCIPPWWAKCVSSWNGFIGGLTIGSSVTLTMEWGADTLDYYAKVGGTTYLMYSYTPNETASHYFMTGTVGRQWPFPGTVKWFQFPGAWSEYNIGQVGWRSRISFPSFIKTGETSWTNVAFAYSTDGPNAFLDNTMVWGGAPYDNVDANYYYKTWPYPYIWPCEQIYFYPTSDGTTLALDTLLWDPYATEPEGCPYVSTWNGTRYILDNNLLATSEHAGGTDVTDYYRLEQTPVPIYKGKWFSLHSLLLSEFENEHSYIDQVKLLAVDHDSDVKVAVSPDGQILTYRNPSPPTSCIDNHENDLLPIIEAFDKNYYTGHPDDYLILDFGNLDVSNGAKLVLYTDLEFKKELCIHVQVLNSTQDWNDVVALHTRVRWATEIVDLSNYLPDANGELKIRLFFMGIHKLDYVSLDTSPQATINVKEGHLISAIHSVDGNVATSLLYSDDNYAELLPGQEIELVFILPKQRMEDRDYIIIVEGHYYTIKA